MRTRKSRAGSGRGHWRRAALSALAASAFAVPGASVALTLEDCRNSADELLHHGGGQGGGDAEDLGGATLMFGSAFAYDGEVRSAVTLVSCRTGNSLMAITSYRKRGKTVFDVTEATKRQLRELARSPKSYSMADVARILEARKIAVRQSVSTEETCPCKALYPEERGRKTAYVYRRAFIEPPPLDPGPGR